MWKEGGSGGGGLGEIPAAAAHLRNRTSRLILSSNSKLVYGRLSANHREAKILVFSAVPTSIQNRF